MTRVLVPLAHGVEEMEAVINIDILRRAGWEVISASTAATLQIKASRRVVLVADSTWDAISGQDFDMILIPGGGPGAAALCKHTGLLATIRRMHEEGKTIAAICAGPTVLQAAGILADRRATCYPSMHDALRTSCEVVDEPVVQDGNIITSQGPGTSMQLALTLVGLIEGSDRARALAAELLTTFAPVERC